MRVHRRPPSASRPVPEAYAARPGRQGRAARAAAPRTARTASRAGRRPCGTAAGATSAGDRGRRRANRGAASWSGETPGKRRPRVPPPVGRRGTLGREVRFSAELRAGLGCSGRCTRAESGGGGARPGEGTNRGSPPARCAPTAPRTRAHDADVLGGEHRVEARRGGGTWCQSAAASSESATPVAVAVCRRYSQVAAVRGTAPRSRSAGAGTGRARRGRTSRPSTRRTSGPTSAGRRPSPPGGCGCTGGGRPLAVGRGPAAAPTCPGRPWGRPSPTGATRRRGGRRRGRGRRARGRPGAGPDGGRQPGRGARVAAEERVAVRRQRPPDTHVGRVVELPAPPWIQSTAGPAGAGDCAGRRRAPECRTPSAVRAQTIPTGMCSSV